VFQYAVLKAGEAGTDALAQTFFAFTTCLHVTKIAPSHAVALWYFVGW